MLRKEKGAIEIAAGVIIGAIILGLIGAVIYFTTIEYQNEQTLEITIKDKYIKKYSDSDTYLVVSEDGETYKITDLLFKGKFNSTDLYNQLDIGKTYKITTTGIRLQYFSMYKNINKIEKVD